MKQLNFFDELIVDNFAGGGGASTGIELATKEALENQIISYFYGGLSIADICKKMKETICSIDSHIKSSADVRKYVSEVIYDYQVANH